MGALIEKLFGGGGPLVSLDTGNACSSQCCDEVVSESSDSVVSPHTILTHESWHEPTSDRIWTTDPPSTSIGKEEESSIPNEAKTTQNKCESGTSVAGPVVLANPGDVQDMKF